jgi:hypothetical protein
MRRNIDESLVETRTRSKTIDELLKNPNVPIEFNEEFHNKLHEVLITFLDYHEKEIELPDEEVKREKELFKWFTQGLKAGHLRGSPRGISKLTSPDVFYILTSTDPAEKMAKKFGVEKHIVKMIRRGEAPGWEWEHRLVQKIMRIVRNRRLNLSRLNNGRYIYILYELDRKTFEKKILYTCLSQTGINRIRERIVTPRELQKHKNADTLDYYYPIEKELISS